jgi:uncharacterized protein (TIGR03083 family)
MFDYLAAIAVESGRVAELVDQVSPESRVPSCPDWSFRELVVHLGLVQRFWGANVRARNPSEPHRSPDDPPEAGADLAGWMRGSTAALLSALEEAGLDAPCWTWWGEPRTAGAVARHQAQEAAVHRWDAEAASGREPHPLEPAVADDGVAEFLEVMLGTAAASVPGPVTLVATDTGGRWQTGGAGGPGARVLAAASDLVLLLYRRIPRRDVYVEGDVAVLDALLAAADIQ